MTEFWTFGNFDDGNCSKHIFTSLWGAVSNYLKEESKHYRELSKINETNYMKCLEPDNHNRYDNSGDNTNRDRLLFFPDSVTGISTTHEVVTFDEIMKGGNKPRLDTIQKRSPMAVFSKVTLIDE